MNESDINKHPLYLRNNFFNDGDLTLCNMVYFPYYFFPFGYFSNTFDLKVPNIEVCQFFSLL